MDSRVKPHHLVIALGVGIGLFTVGALKTVQTRKNPWISGAENLALGLLGGAVAYGVGSLFDSIIRS